MTRLTISKVGWVSVTVGNWVSVSVPITLKDRVTVAIATAVG